MGRHDGADRAGRVRQPAVPGRFPSPMAWHIEGVKRFITAAEHDLTENIIHLVLARPQGVDGVGGPGTKGLLCSSCPSSALILTPVS